MLTENELMIIAESNVKEIEKEAKIALLIVHQQTIKKSYGNIFFYTSKKFFETQDDKYAVAGNAQFLVENKTGDIVEFGTAMGIDYYLAEYEAGRWPSNRKLL